MAAAALTVPQRLQGLPPVAAANAHVLILGSFAGVASLAAGQYYAHPRNQFWPLLSAVLDEPLQELTYRARLARIRSRGIAVWDTIVGCARTGSLDSAIRDVQRGEVATIAKRAPDLRAVAFKGGRASREGVAWREAGYATLTLPSSSPAYTRPFAEKLAAWRAIAAYLDARD